MRGRVRVWGAVASLAVLLTAACGTRVSDSSSGAVAAQQQRASASAGADGAGDATAGDASGPAGGDAASTGTGSGTAAGGTVSGPGAGTGGSASATASGEKTAATVKQGGPPIVIGAVGTESGVVGAQGAAVWLSLRTWVQAVNAKGGINGRQVKLVIVDDGGDPGRNGAAVRQLIDQDHVIAFVGSYAPISFSGGLPAIEKAGLPAIGGDSAEAGWFTSPNAFPFNGEALPQGKAIGLYGCQSMKQTKLAIYYVQEIAFGGIIANTTAQYWSSCGKKVVAKTGVSLAQPDFTSEVLQAKGAGADAVAIFSDNSGCRRFWDAARRQNFKPVWFAAVSCYNPGVADAKDMIANNIYAGISTELPTADTPGMNEMRAALTRFNGSNVNFIDGELPLGWASGKLYEAAIAAAGGKTDPAAILAALRAMKNQTLDGITAPLTYGPGAHPEKPCAKLATYDGSKWTAATPQFIC